MMRKLCKQVEWYLYKYDDIKKAISEKRGELSARKQYTGGSNSHAFVSDPTACQAINNILPLKEVELSTGESIREPELVVEIIEYMINNADGITSKVVKSKFFEKKKWWITCSELSIGKDVYYDSVHEFTYETLLFFVNYGVIKMKNKFSPKKTAKKVL